MKKEKKKDIKVKTKRKISKKQEQKGQFLELGSYFKSFSSPLSTTSWQCPNTGCVTEDDSILITAKKLFYLKFLLIYFWIALLFLCVSMILGCLLGNLALV